MDVAEKREAPKQLRLPRDAVSTAIIGSPAFYVSEQINASTCQNRIRKMHHQKRKQVEVEVEDHVITISPTPQYIINGQPISVEEFQHMKPEVYRAITMGNTDGSKLIEEDRVLGKHIISGRGNTHLHVAASLGHSSLVQPILICSPHLIFTQNPNGNTVLHLAAAAGHQTFVETLVRHIEQLQPPWNRPRDVLIKENEEKNTALHLAMKNNHYNLAKDLVKMNPEATVQLNGEGVSPLYMATEAGHVELVNLMLESIPADRRILRGCSKSLVHAAIKTRNIDVLDAIMRYQSSHVTEDVLRAVKVRRATYINASVGESPSYCISFDDGEKTSFCIVLLDEEGRTPLSFASSIGYLEGVCYFLDKTFDATYTRDEDGSYPIHAASMGGHVEIIKKFIRLCPDSWELLDGEGKNILHVAAESGKSNVVRYILETSELTMLINERDKQGNTPLHLASKNGHARVVSIMTWDKKVNLKLVNEQGLTALDVADNNQDTTPLFLKGLTWLALGYAGAPRAKQLSTSKVSKQSPRNTKSHKKRAKHQKARNMESYKDRVNTLLLVATLVATVTFAAGFTMPGGFNSSDHDSHQGMATLVKKSMFQVFLISNTIAMYSSIVVVILLFWSLMNDLRLGLASHKLAVPLLGISISMVSLAFMAAIYVVVSNLTWLSIVVLIIGSLFLLALLVLIVPLAFPNSLKHRISRYIIRYPFSLLILVIERIDKNE